MTRKLPVRPAFLSFVAVSLVALGADCATPISPAAETKIGIIMEARPAEQPWSAAIYDAAQALTKKDSSVKLLLSYKAYDPTSAEPVARQMIEEGAVVV